MANFGRNDLQHQYSWTVTEGDSKKVIGFPDNVLLNRHEGFEVLHFINKYMTTRNLDALRDFHIIERAIQTNLPSNIRSQAHVKQWLDLNLR